MNNAAAKRARRRRRALAPGIVPGGLCSRCRKCGPAGECFDPAIKSGRCGDWVWYVWKGHQWRRLWVKGLDPKTAKQMAWRAALAATSKAYSDLLTEQEQEACIKAGAKRRTRPRLGDSGSETGHQYWVGKELTEKPPVPAPKLRKRKT